MKYERTCRIERAEADAPGLISGVLVTDGEASDGHILNIPGVKLPARAPLLFGHDDFTGTGNLGSWTGFSKFEGSKLGKSGIRGSAQIEMGGTGSQQDFRDDVAHMIGRGHIGQFSVRWDEIDGSPPVRRVNLPSDHPAFVDAEKATGRQQWGLFFDKWRMLEGSVVTLGADPAALIGRMQEAEGDVRGYWRSAVNHALTEREEISGLVAVQTGVGQIFVERAAYDAILESANERLQLALDLYEEDADALRDAAIKVSEIREGLETPTRAEPERDETPTELDQAPSTEAPADQQAPTQPAHRLDTAAVLELMGQQLDENTKRLHEDFLKMMDSARGRVKK